MNNFVPWVYNEMNKSTNFNDTLANGQTTHYPVGDSLKRTAWISLKDRKPEYGKEVLLLVHGEYHKYVKQGYLLKTSKNGDEFNGDTWPIDHLYSNTSDMHRILGKVTHWMELPSVEI